MDACLLLSICLLVYRNDFRDCFGPTVIMHGFCLLCKIRDVASVISFWVSTTEASSISEVQIGITQYS